MKKNCVFILFMFTLILNSQQLMQYKLVAKKDSSTIKDAFILCKDKVIALSDSLGNFSIDLKLVTDSIYISHVNFKNKILTQPELQILTFISLEEELNELDEVIINMEKYKTKKIFPNQSLLTKLGYFKGHNSRANAIYVTYLPNNFENIQCKIKRIFIESHSGYWGDDKKQFMPFEVNLFTVDNVTKLPGKKILPDNLLVSKNESDKKYIVINVKNYSLEFPSEGIFVSIQTLTDAEYLNFQNISFSPPAFKIIKPSKKYPYVSYSRWLGENGNTVKDWIDDKYNFGLSYVYNFGIEVELID